MKRFQLVAVGLLLIGFELLVLGMPKLSLTFDEPSHLASGYTALARGVDGLWTMNARGHPVLVDAWVALPLYAGNPTLSLEELPGWKSDYKVYVRSFIRAIGPLEATEIAGRVPAALLTVILAATVYRWGQDLTQGRSGWIGLVLLIFDPNCLAHGRLATNDIGVTALGTLALYLTWHHIRSPRRMWTVLVGATLGLACLAKSSGILWLAAVGLYMLVRIVKDKQQRMLRLLQTLQIGGVAILTIWAAYGFDIGQVHNGISLPLPAPLHWRTLFFQTDSADQRLAYALGNLKMGGWWWYFPLTWAIKTPVPLMLLVLTGSVILVRHKRYQTDSVVTVIFTASYATVAIVQGPNIGYRHLLPVQPLLLLLATTAADALLITRRAPGGRKRLRALIGPVLVAMGCWYAVGTVASTPNEIAYFNLIAGPTINKHKFLISSNLDWGQMMKQTAAYLRKHQDETTYVAISHPAPYPLPATDYLPPNPDADPIIAPLHPPAGRYLIGATSLHIPSSCCGLGLDGYAYLRNLTPDDTIGGAILIYTLTEDTQPTWLVQCGTIKAPLSEETVARGFENPEQLRNIQLNCGQSWIYPAGPGVYAFADDDDLWEPTFVQKHLASTRLSYQQPAGFIPEPFVLYESLAQPELDLLDDSLVANAETPPNAIDVKKSDHNTYIRSLEFLGASRVPDSSKSLSGTDTATIEVATWWRVIDALPPEPFSIMAHLITSTGANLSVADGFDIAPAALRPSDIFVQRHVFQVPAESVDQELWLRTGIYQLDDLSRWPVNACLGCDAMFTPLNAYSKSP